MQTEDVCYVIFSNYYLILGTRLIKRPFFGRGVMHINNTFSSFGYVGGHFKHWLALFSVNAQILRMGNEDGRNCYILFKF